MKTLYEQKVAELELQVQNVTLSNADLRTQLERAINQISENKQDFKTNFNHQL